MSPKSPGKSGPETRLSPPPDPLHNKIMKITHGYMGAQALMTAVEIGLFDALSRGSLSGRQLARKINCSERGVLCLTDALLGIGLLSRNGNQLALTRRTADLLLTSGSNSVTQMLLHQKRLYDRWSKLNQSVRAGKPVSQSATGPAARKRFLAAMIDGSRPSIATMMKLIDFSKCCSFLDVGGGAGAYPIALIDQYPRMQAAIFDTPETIAAARGFLKTRGLEKTILTLSGDARSDKLGGPYDMILISNVLHIFGPNDIVRILRNMRRSLARGGRILVKDFFLSSNRRGPEFASLFSLNMLVSTEAGSVFSESEFDALLQKARLKRTRRYQLGVASQVIAIRACSQR